MRGKWRIDPAYLDLPFDGRTALLSPLDRPVFDRLRANEIFEVDYQLEMYKPAGKRRWGYFALPILHGDRLVGKVDAASDRAGGVLEIARVHEDGEWSAALRADVDAEIDALAGWSWSWSWSRCGSPEPQSADLQLLRAAIRARWQRYRPSMDTSTTSDRCLAITRLVSLATPHIGGSRLN